MASIVTDKNIYSRVFIENIREMIRPIIENVIKPNAEIIDKTGKFPRENLLALVSCS
jgi:hypothetical protein